MFKVIVLEFASCRKSKRMIRKVGAECQKRRQARQWCRHRRWSVDGLVIKHPDGTLEPFIWDGHNFCPDQTIAPVV